MSSACISLENQSIGTLPRELRANVFSHRWGVVVQVFVPGCEPSQVRVRVKGEFLTVVANPLNAERGLPLCTEREMGESEREFSLTPDLDIGHLTRSVIDGVLTMIIPRHGALAPDSES